MTHILSALAGGRRDAMRRAPAALNQAATTGVIMLLTAIIASMTMGYALHRSFIGDRFAMHIAIAGGMLWGAFVLALDRLLLLGIDKTDTKLKLVLQLLLRLPIAVVVGVAISKPVILRLSQTILDLNLREARISTLDQERKKFAGDAGLDPKRNRVDSLRDAIRKQELRVQSKPNSFECDAARQDLQSAESRLRTVREANQNRIANARQLLARIANSEKPEDIRRARTLRSNIDRWRSEITRAAENVAAADRRLTEVEQQWMATENEKLVQMRADLKRAEQEHKSAEGVVGHQTTVSNDELSRLMRPNLVNEYTMLKRIQADPNNPDAQSLVTFELALDFLFILFEMTPLLSKVLSKVNALDHATAAVEMEDEERINQRTLANLAYLQKVMEMSRHVHDTALEQWASSQMEAIERHPNMTAQILRDLRNEISTLPIMTTE